MEAEKKENEEEHERERGVDDDVKNHVDETAAPSGGAGEGELNAYELERERNIARNRARMEAVVGESKRGFAASAAKGATMSSSSFSQAQHRRRRPPRPRPPPPSSSTPAEARRAMPTRTSRRLARRTRSSGSRSPSPNPDPDQMNRTPPDCRKAAGAIFSRSSRPVVPARFVRGVPSSDRGAASEGDAEALRRLNCFRLSYMSRAALFNRVMAISNALKLEDFAAVLEKEGRGDLAALAREKLSLMKEGNAAAVRDFVLRSKEAEYERREREAAEEQEEEEEGGGGE